ncbi:MAG: tetratricopeptide repeat protein [Acidobacteriota bacterium]|nr:tetratricopeptide repeat protein [Acidobacteriota bacterium]
MPLLSIRCCGFLATALLLCSCVHQPKIAAIPAVPVTAPVTAFDRQITNAVDAGEGDVLVKSLRYRVIAHPEELTPRLELAKAYRQRGYPELAIEHLRLAAARFPDSAETQLLLAKELRASGMPAEGANTLDRYLQAHPQKSANYVSWLGILRDEAGQWNQGEIAHRSALTLAPGRDDLHNNLGYCLMMQKKNDAAVEEFRAALRLKPDSRIARNNLGTALAANPNADSKDAILNWQSVSDPATAHNNLGALLIERRQYAEARKELELALGYNRIHPAALNNLKLVAALDGKSASVPAKPVKTGWAKFRILRRRVEQRAEAVQEREQTASR